MSSSNNRIISKHDKRISLRCPCSIASSTLEQDKTDKKYSIKLTVANEGDGGIYNDTVQSASLVIRCTDIDGNNIQFDDNEYLVKTVSFGDEGLERSQEITMAVMLGDFDGTEITDFEVYISRIRFADGTVLDYLRADFFPVPAKPVPLSKKLSETEVLDAQVDFGESAEFFPEKLSEVVWRCTCGEICESSRCPMCQNERDALFSFFGITATVTPKGDKIAPSAKSAQNKTKAAVIIALSSVAALLLIILIAALLTKCDSSPDNGDGSEEDTTTTTTTTTTTNTDSNTAETLATAYADAGQFDQALDVCLANNLSEEFTDSIREKAVSYHSTKGDYVRAYDYASAMTSYAALPSIIEGAFSQSVEAGNYADAVKFANLLGDAEKKTAAIKALTDGLIASGDYLGAYNAATENEEVILASQIAEDGIAALRSEHKFDDAIALAKASGNENAVTELNSEAADYYIGIEDYSSAAKYAAASGDSTVIENLCSKLDDGAIKKNLPSYFEYLPLERKRAVLATNASGGRLVSLITPDGKVLYGMGEVYEAPNGLTPISVSSGTSHTVILLSDGSVVALGDNTYGQCNLSSITKAVAISAGADHTVVLLEDGTVRAFGNNTYGQCNLSSFTDVVSISAGDTFTLALTKDGKVLSTSSDIDFSTVTDAVAVSAGRVHALAITTEGKVVLAGSSLLGMGAVEGWENVVAIDCSSTFSVGLAEDGSVLFAGTVIDNDMTDKLPSLKGAVQIFAEEGYILAYYEDGTVKAVGPLAPHVDTLNEAVKSNKNEG